MFDKLRERLRRPVDPSPEVLVADEPIGPETPQEAIDRVTDPRARVVVREQVVTSPATPVSESSSGWSAGRLRPSGLPRFALAAMTIAVALVALRELQGLASFVAPAFFALNLMITAYPLQRWLARHKVPTWLGSIMAGVTVLVALSLIMFGLAYSVTAMVGELPKYTEQFTSLYTETIGLATKYLNLDEAQLLEKLKGVDPQSLLGLLGGVLSNAQGISSLLLITVTTLIFMVMDSAGIEERLRAAERSHPDLVFGLQNFARGIRKFWMVTTVFGIVVAVLDYGILVGLGVPLALTWALFSFLTNYIPNVGFILGVIPPALLALVDQGWKASLIVVVLYSVVNFVVQSIVQPKIAGDAVGLTPTLSFLSLLLWTYVLGAMGALIALPASLLVKALLVDIDPDVRWVNTLISSRIADGEPTDEQRRAARA